MARKRKGKPLGAQKQWSSGYSQSRFFPGFGGKGRDEPLSTRGKLIYRVVLMIVIALGIAGIVYEVVRS